MKFKLLSDLHLEFYKDNLWEPKKTPNDKDTILLLAGDIHIGMKALPWIEKMCDRFKEVIYILGNHEFYSQEYYKTINKWQEVFQGGNFTFLHNDYYDNEEVAIFGATLWTHVTDPHTRWIGQQRMNDYRVIKIQKPIGIYRRINVQDTNDFHLETIKYLKDFLKKDFRGKKIVMTHHLPHPICVHPRYHNHYLNDFYLTNLDNIIADNNIDVWIHGHTHDNVDKTIHNTRILCNPMGYQGFEMNPNFNEDFIFEL
jgi:predicted phosphodiesterase